jgi:hypothetical protein
VDAHAGKLSPTYPRRHLLLFEIILTISLVYLQTGILIGLDSQISPFSKPRNPRPMAVACLYLHFQVWPRNNTPVVFTRDLSMAISWQGRRGHKSMIVRLAQKHDISWTWMSSINLQCWQHYSLQEVNNISKQPDSKLIVTSWVVGLPAAPPSS